MTRATVESLASAIVESASLILKLIDECPDHLWNEKAGKWPIWQHLAHCASASNFFLPGERVPLAPGLTEALVDFEVVGTEPVSKDALRASFKAAQIKLDNFLAPLKDEDLSKDNQHLKAYGLDWSIVKTLSLVSGHFYYHLGNADAVLRSHGHQGIF
ncbi:MAG: DinB family protein [Deltaproteobacteria bacterium]|jgi:uncharacterized damage-inducible protein DinB|nr:DinB family protein [Deltaproteobacteria bacterium]